MHTKDSATRRAGVARRDHAPQRAAPPTHPAPPGRVTALRGTDAQHPPDSWSRKQQARPASILPQAVASGLLPRTFKRPTRKPSTAKRRAVWRKQKSTALEMQTARPQPRRPPCRPSLHASLAPARTSGTRAGGHSAPGHRMDKLVSSSSVCPSRLSRKKNDGPIVPWRAATGWSTRSTDRDGKAMCTL